MRPIWAIALAGAVLLTGCGQTTSPTASTSETSTPLTGTSDKDLPFDVTLEENSQDDSLQVRVEQEGHSITVVTPTLNGTTMGNSGEVSLVPFADVMGYSGFCEAHPRVGASWTEWYYYALVDATPVCIGESYGTQQQDTVRDLDGDGITELICTCTYGGSSRFTVLVFRGEGDTIYRSQVNVGTFVSAEDYLQMNPNDLSSWYEAETGTFALAVGTETYGPQWPKDFTEAPYSPSYLVKIQDN